MSSEPAHPREHPDGKVAAEDYARMDAAARSDPEAFWTAVGARLEWIEPPTCVRDISSRATDPHAHWYAGGVLNACVNCLDRHLAARGDEPAVTFECGAPAVPRSITYRTLRAAVCRFANALAHLGIDRGDRIAIYLPTSPEAVIAMLACARIGAIHVVVPARAPPAALAAVLADARCRFVVTADGTVSAGRELTLKDNVDAALTYPHTTRVETVVVVRRHGGFVNIQSPRDRWYADLVEGQPDDCAPVPMRAEDPLLMTCTQSTEGRPAVMAHATAAYLAWAACTHAAAAGPPAKDGLARMTALGEQPLHGCAAVYGALANGATALLRDGATDGIATVTSNIGRAP